LAEQPIWFAAWVVGVVATMLTAAVFANAWLEEPARSRLRSPRRA
jgi:hypothetical protein